MTADPKQIERQQAERERREREAIREARRLGRCISYIDDDGCEVTATPGGHTFYNAADWW